MTAQADDADDVDNDVDVELGRHWLRQYCKATVVVAAPGP